LLEKGQLWSTPSTSLSVCGWVTKWDTHRLGGLARKRDVEKGKGWRHGQDKPGQNLGLCLGGRARGIHFYLDRD